LNKLEEVASAKSMNSEVKKTTMLFTEKRVNKERAIIKTENMNTDYYQEKEEVSNVPKVNVGQCIQRQSNSTADSIGKVINFSGNMTSRLNAINIRPKKKDKIIINVKYSQYEIISTVAKEHGFKVTKSDK